MRASLVFWMSVLVAARAPGVDPVPPALPAPANSAPAVGTAALFGPRADFAEMIHDFGKIQAGAVVRHDFVFTNTG
ncbi:MAG: hypothetical protein JNL97_10175, partial [Verrucomicrobiales bacterium]|nr:hypothetical protein [Verrucomicrobiales bacterium]